MTMARNNNPTARRVTEHDQRIGKRIRVLRQDRGLSQTELAEACGITFQQIQKYENGRNRIAGGRLVDMAALLGVEPAYLLGAVDKPTKPHDTIIERMLADLHGAKLARAFLSIGDRTAQADIAVLVENYAKAFLRKPNGKPSKRR
jgi:transcriptional regulator with XRE-family HTH domain